MVKNMNTVIEVRNLEKSFDEKCVIKQVSFRVNKGEILGIVGESGSGKSTIARMICRLTDVDYGDIYLYDKNITRVIHQEQRQIYQEIQMIFQNPRESFHPKHKLGTSIIEGMRNQKVAKKNATARMYELLEACGLPLEYAARYPHEISIGECQRAAIARALATNPSVIIFDEATSALDVTIQKQIIELLMELQVKANLTYLFISHDLALVQQICHRLIIIKEGQIIEEGMPDNIINNPATAYTKELIEAAFQWE